MTTVTATEFKQNLGKYLILAQSEDIEITKNGKSSARLTSTRPRPTADTLKPVGSISELFGILPKNGMTLEEAREMRLREKCGY